MSVFDVNDPQPPEAAGANAAGTRRAFPKVPAVRRSLIQKVERQDPAGRSGPVSSDRVYLTYFNAGLRVYDLADPFRPREVPFYVPGPPPGQMTLQWNDVLVTVDGLIFVTDRLNGGLYVLEHVCGRSKIQGSAGFWRRVA
jgi:hypothetical protein